MLLGEECLKPEQRGKGKKKGTHKRNLFAVAKVSN